MGYAQPVLHIDFVTTFEKNDYIRGYWFITHLFGPNSVVVWVKLHNGRWRRDALRDPGMDDNMYAEAKPGPNGYVFAEGGLDSRLNQMVDSYKASCGLHGYPYDY
jgi:hypothetical protein